MDCLFVNKIDNREQRRFLVYLTPLFNFKNFTFTKTTVFI